MKLKKHWITVALLAVSFGAQATVYYWSGTLNDSYNVAGNWTDLGAGSAVPGVGDLALMNNNVSGSAPWPILSTAVASPNVLGVGWDSPSGSLTCAAGGSLSTTTLRVGFHSNGTLNMLGGTIVATQLDVGFNDGAGNGTGTLNLSGDAVLHTANTTFNFGLINLAENAQFLINGDHVGNGDAASWIGSGFIGLLNAGDTLIYTYDVGSSRTVFSVIPSVDPLTIELVMGTNSMALAWDGDAGSGYAVEEASSLVDADWAPSLLVGVGVDMGLAATTAVDQAQGFVRVVRSTFDPASEPWRYLDNGTVRLGIDPSRGACIGYLAHSTTGRNLLNHFDTGRFIQQSYYGDADGSDWNGTPWNYNPVQGGSWQGNPSQLVELREDLVAGTLYAKIIPRHWASGQLLPEAIMEETISLSGAVAHIHFKLTYSGPTQAAARHQEMPAVFVDYALPNHVYMGASGLVRHVPGWPNEYGTAVEDWSAFLDENDWGIGILTPGTPAFTAYRYDGNFSTGPTGAACSYVAPIRTLKLTTGLVLEHDVYLTLGTLAEIQARFSALSE